MVFLKCLKATSVVSERDDEQPLLLHHGWRHTKCSCILSSVHATASRNRRNEKQNHPLYERMCQVASTTRSCRLLELPHRGCSLQGHQSHVILLLPPFTRKAFEFAQQAVDERYPCCVLFY